MLKVLITILVMVVVVVAAAAAEVVALTCRPLDESQLRTQRLDDHGVVLLRRLHVGTLQHVELSRW
jgi:hypothetical protein